MNFKTVKPTLKKSILWFGSLTFSIIVITLIIILSSPMETKTKVSWASQILLNFILVYLVCVCLNIGKTMVSLFYNLEIKTDLETKEQEVNVIKSNYCYIFLLVFTIGCFFIEMTSGSLINKVSWVINAKDSWWIYLILFMINFIYIYLFIEITKYLIQNNNDFKKEYLEQYNKKEENLKLKD
ncbi:hypothetical protein [Spiroplasma taiwanense]|uniref:Transmembrane protein n=1 Tax=Spiroplasma taiwanense CT-1 TaxID=1276220 RepID=S5LSY0_9MOLU|nr:hypothetical protein [Spiroplasma taiwanense]AGR40779.1 hypothetical protein STAIW_v1c00870 [Spiroplasma taiwanense CT-1]